MRATDGGGIPWRPITRVIAALGGLYGALTELDRANEQANAVRQVDPGADLTQVWARHGFNALLILTAVVCLYVLTRFTD